MVTRVRFLSQLSSLRCRFGFASLPESREAMSVDSGVSILAAKTERDVVFGDES